MKFTRRVRAILSRDSNRIMLIKRMRDGVDPYWVTPGGGVEEFDENTERALAREVSEELGAKIEILKLVFVMERKTAENLATKESFFLCRLVDYDLAARTGPEFNDPSRGQYVLDEIVLDAQALEQTNIKPEELKEFLVENSNALFHLPDLRDSSESRKFTRGCLGTR
jgi:ADP-ribose pyrophosphatase YjhB (NUDIX family)